jgi:hypothetical protein
MAIVRYNVEVIRKDEYEIAIDDAIWTPEAIQEWNDHFANAKSKKDIASNLAKAITHEGIQEHMEGFGYVKQRTTLSSEGLYLHQNTLDRKTVTDDKYTEGLQVTIIQHKVDYETEIMKLRTK